MLIERGENLEEVGKVITLPEGTYVSSGWIDLHTHAFPKFKPYCAVPDDIGYKTGVATVIDAGSSGADDFEEFLDYANRSKTKVLSFLNVSRIGLAVSNELTDLTNIHKESIIKTVRKYPDTIVGLKVRMSKSVIGDSGISPLIEAKKIARELDLPIMVHIGNAPPKLADILPLIDAGDIVTHCFNEKPNNHIFYEDGENLRTLKEAVDRGVYLDIIHGSSSFSFDIARRAKEEGISFDSISTDIYEGNQEKGPVFNLATTLTKFLALGFSLEELLPMVTTNPAKILKRDHLGEAKLGEEVDLTFFQVKDQPFTLKDSLGNELISSRQIVPYAVYLGGEFHDL